jgi:protocatechuate 3,4-dioxygenase alpha subunit
MTALPQTPSQTVGPFFHDGLISGQEHVLTRPGVRGPAIVITGQVLDGEGVPLPDALVEIWQADAAGIYPHPADPRHAEADPNFTGFGRSATRGPDLAYRFETIKSGRVAGVAARGLQAPHVLVRIFARGLLTHLSTRLYFADEGAANGSDAVLAGIGAERRSTLIAAGVPAAAGGTPPAYRLDFVLQGPGETVFFEP